MNPEHKTVNGTITFNSYNELLEHLRGVYYARYNIQLDDETLRLIIRMNEFERTFLEKMDLSNNEIKTHQKQSQLAIIEATKDLNKKIDELHKALGNIEKNSLKSDNTILLKANVIMLIVLSILTLFNFF